MNVCIARAAQGQPTIEPANRRTTVNTLPLGGATHCGGAGDADLRRGHFSVQMYAKMQELCYIPRVRSLLRKDCCIL